MCFSRNTASFDRSLRQLLTEQVNTRTADDRVFIVDEKKNRQAHQRQPWPHVFTNKLLRGKETVDRPSR